MTISLPAKKKYKKQNDKIFKSPTETKQKFIFSGKERKYAFPYLQKISRQEKKTTIK